MRDLFRFLFCDSTSAARVVIAAGDLVTVFQGAGQTGGDRIDLSAVDANAQVSLEPFVDIIGRNFKQPKEGLGYDNSPVAHMWRTIERPDAPL